MHIRCWEGAVVVTEPELGEGRFVPALDIFSRIVGLETGGWNGQLLGAVLTGSDMCLSLQGGPCGVLAAVQGCVLQKLLFEGDRKTNSNL